MTLPVIQLVIQLYLLLNKKLRRVHNIHQLNGLQARSAFRKCQAVRILGLRKLHTATFVAGGWTLRGQVEDLKGSESLRQESHGMNFGSIEIIWF